ncbi:hypothetical protein [Tsukamurella columbiensis]|uniref:Helix-turn-helix transcriptional regulator n=1 Tax=Tsukamurella columbiensis TaxID=128509 RepID=A0ABX1LI91_9ACTN|nr:hypothetical protein [Tsukamurella columbiensis]NMD58001.1 hypothetical protein [Tsukamurella columbiensis]
MYGTQPQVPADRADLRQGGSGRIVYRRAHPGRADTTIVERLQLLRDVAAFTRNVDPDTIARLAQAAGFDLSVAAVRTHFNGTREPSQQDLRAYRIVLGYGEENWQLFSVDPAVYSRSVENLQSLLVALRQQYYHGMRRVTP